MAFSVGDGEGGGDVYRPLAEINVTPLVDVMLVLLIIFMVTAPLMMVGVKVNLPNAGSAQALTAKPPLVVSIDRGGILWLGSDRLELDTLAESVKAQLGDDKDRIVHIRGDKDAAFGGVVAALDRLASSGVTHVAIVTSPRTEAVTKASP